MSTRGRPYRLTIPIKAAFEQYILSCGAVYYVLESGANGIESVDEFLRCKQSKKTRHEKLVVLTNGAGPACSPEKKGLWLQKRKSWDEDEQKLKITTIRSTKAFNVHCTTVL